VIDEAETKKAFARATDSMARLNRTAAKLMHKHNAHCATDITGTQIPFTTKKFFSLR